MVQPATVASEADASQEASEPEPAASHSRVTSVPACLADPRHLVFERAHQRNVTATCAPLASARRIWALKLPPPQWCALTLRPTQADLRANLCMTPVPWLIEHEWAKHGINVNAICPGYIDTEINHHHWQTEQGQKLVQMLPRKRVGQVQDLDAVLVMLCANESHFINGAVISADDGAGV